MNMEILENENGDVIVRVDELKANLVLIWYSLNDNVTYVSATNDINCLIDSGRSFVINDLKTNLIYTFCLMDPMKETISPLDRISYTKKVEYEILVWLYENNKSQFFGISSVLCALSTFVGFGMGFFAYKVKFFESNKIEDSIRSDM